MYLTSTKLFASIILLMNMSGKKKGRKQEKNEERRMEERKIEKKEAKEITSKIVQCDATP